MKTDLLFLAQLKRYNIIKAINICDTYFLFVIGHVSVYISMCTFILHQKTTFSKAFLKSFEHHQHLLKWCSES